MILLALPIVAAAAAAPPAARTFWTFTAGPQRQPTQVEVPARLVREGASIAVYQEEGYRFSTLGAGDETRQVDDAVRLFDTVIYPREGALFGPCPDRDGNGKVILLVTRNAPSAGLFSPFDEMSDAEAMRYGFHSNDGEILYHAFDQQGNRAARNVQELAETFHRLLHYARDPGETAWSKLLANYTPYLCGLASARLLWGDIDPDGRSHPSTDPWTSRGWSLLFVEYLREQLGEDGLRHLVMRPEKGLAGVNQLLAERGDARASADLLGDFAMACWLDDAALGDGRLSFSGVVPPRPPTAAHAVASRPTSGAIDVGVGGMAFLLIDGDGERPFPLTLQGEASVRWVGRAVKLRMHGPDQELALQFAPSGIAKLDLPALTAEEKVVVAAAAVPGDSPLFDSRVLLLRWGIGWVPHAPVDQGRDTVLAQLKKELPDAGAAAATRLTATLDRLDGGRPSAPDAPAITTRYAWSPQAATVVAALVQEAEARGLPARSLPFLRRAPNGVEQDWANVLIELPGTDARRWPVVLAAHWDGARADLWDSYLRALNVNDNATGVAVALETASAMSRLPHRAPVLVALLDGGYHDAAGAHALLEQLGGKVSAWVELDGVGVPEPWPATLALHLEGGKDLLKFPWSTSQAFRHVGFTVRTQTEISAPHTGGDLALARGIPALVVRTRPAAGDEDLDAPPSVERGRVSPELMVLLVKALAAAVTNLAGAP